MSPRSVLTAVTLSILPILIMISCSQSQETVSGVSGDQLRDNLISTPLPTGIIEIFPDGTPSSGYGAMGVYNLHIDPSNSNVELMPLRNLALTDVLEVVDITSFLRLAPCTDCVKIRSVSLDEDNNLVVSIGIKHPFPAGDPFKPISGRNRADLHVFNVEGTVVSNLPGISFTGIGETVAPVGLVNADGYSKYLDTVFEEIYPTQATIHPYITHFDDYSQGNFNPNSPTGFTSVTEPAPSGNLVMPMGCNYDFQDYKFNLSGSVDFIFAVGCTYAVSSAAKLQRFNPEYRVPQHNKKAASEVSIAITSNDLKAGDISSTAQIEIRVVDISHGVPVGDGLDQMLSDSSVAEISIDVPGVISNPVVINGSSSISGTGHNPADPLVYSGTIANQAGASDGIYNGLVKVRDNYSPGQNQSPLLAGMDGIKRVDPIANPLEGLFVIDEFTTYATFKLSVEIGNEPPIAVLEPDPGFCYMGESIDYTGINSTDPDGSIVQYEFDFDWNGVESNFSADTSNTTGLATSFIYASAGSYTAGLRVTDDLGATAYDAVQVDVAHVDVIYVDDSYVGPPYDGTIQHPFRTITEGLVAAPANYQVWVDDSGNNYQGPITTKSNVILRSVNWDNSDGGNMAAIYVNGPSGIANCVANSTIDGFKLHGSYTSGVSVNGDNAVVKNCWITDIGLTYASSIVEGMRINACDGVVIDNCEFSHIQLNTSSGILDCIYLMGPTNVTITRCRIHDFNRNTDSGILIPVYFNTVTGIEFTNNMIYDINSPANGINIGVYFNTSINANFKNNIIMDIYEGGYNVYGFYVGNECTGFVGVNNIIGDFPGNYGIIGEPGAVWNYNDVFNTGTSGMGGIGNITDNPMFVDPLGDFHLQSGSPCIDAGDPSIQDPDGSRSDIGAYGGPLA